jgi:hypothetical protein
VLTLNSIPIRGSGEGGKSVAFAILGGVGGGSYIESYLNHQRGQAKERVSSTISGCDEEGYMSERRDGWWRGDLEGYRYQVRQY